MLSPRADTATPLPNRHLPEMRVADCGGECCVRVLDLLLVCYFSSGRVLPE